MWEASAIALRASLDRGELTAQQITQHFLEAIDRRNETLGAFLRINHDGALEQAARVDAKFSKGEPLGKLAGIPIAIKDNICVAGLRATCASKILANFVPPYDAHVVRRLLAEDAIIIGKTNLDEFGMGSSGELSAFKTPRNPWNPEYTPGGSSSGSAVAVAADLAPLALGSDTGGSIRLPSSFCGVVGMKPTYGRVSRYGLIAYGSSLEQIGPFARSVEDLALLLEVLAGLDDRDSTSIDQSVPSYSESLRKPVNNLTIGIAQEHFGEGLHDEVHRAVQAAMEVFRGMGATVKPISLPHTRYAVATYYLIVTAEASSNLARYDGVHFGHRASEYEDLIDMVARSRNEGFGPEVKRRILLGTFALSAGYKEAYYLKAQKVRQLIKEEYDRALRECLVLLCPTSPTAAFRFGEVTKDPLAMYLGDVYTVPCNLCGIPGMSLPCGFTSNGIPIGLQLIGPAFGEELLLRVGQMYQQQTDWHTRRPSEMPAA